MTANCRSKNTADIVAGVSLALCMTMGGGLFAQAEQTTAVGTSGRDAAAAAVTAITPRDIPKGAVTPPADYVIGVDDKLSIVYWKDKDMSADVIVRPDGKISLPLLNEVTAAGLTPGQLRDRISEESRRYVEDANIIVVVMQINSRRVFITGEVNKPGPYPLAGPTTVLQLIAMAGGLRDYANGKNILIMRNENSRPVSLRFSYQDVIARKNLKHNVELKPGDTVVVP
jgi:polysaccharide export outer membrane protein